MTTNAPASTDVSVALRQARSFIGQGPLLLASDFDGTLSPLHLDPWSARIVPAARRALRRLAGTPDIHVALISGRTATDLAARARVGGISYRGDHGAERAEASRGFRPEALNVTRESARPSEQQMADRLAIEVPDAVGEPWLIVERKGAGLTFHFRGAPDVASARSHVVEAVDAVDPDGLLARSGGLRALELRPHDASTKGTALRQLIDEHRPATVIMLGDDRNDALAFDVLTAARSAGEVDGLAIAVAGHPDVTAGVAPRADLLLAGPSQTARLLAGLATAPGRFD